MTQFAGSLRHLHASSRCLLFFFRCLHFAHLDSFFSYLFLDTFSLYYRPSRVSPRCAGCHTLGDGGVDGFERGVARRSLFIDDLSHSPRRRCCFGIVVAGQNDDVAVALPRFRCRCHGVVPPRLALGAGSPVDDETVSCGFIVFLFFESSKTNHPAHSFFSPLTTKKKLNRHHQKTKAPPPHPTSALNAAPSPHAQRPAEANASPRTSSPRRPGRPSSRRPTSPKLPLIKLSRPNTC